MVNVLLIVPFQSDLALLPAEAEGVINQLQPRRVLQGEVTEQRLVDTIQADLREGGPYTGVWIATHTSERAVKLSDGEIGKDAFVMYMALTGATWIVLNGCEGEGMAASLVAIGMDVITTALTPSATGIKDRDAWRMAKLLASSLVAHDGDLRAAYDSIPNASRLYGFFPASDAIRSLRSEDSALYGLLYEVRSEVAKLGGRVDNLDSSVRRLEQKSEGHVTPIGAIAITLIISFVFSILEVLLFVQLHGGLNR